MIMNARLSNSARSRLALACIAAFCLLVLASIASPLAAQEQEKKDDAKSQTAAATPPPSDGFQFGVYQGHSEFEVGYRMVDHISGSQDVYRSMVDLGEGPKLLRSSLSLRSKYGTGGLFDRLDLSLNNWGGDPYNTMHLNMGRSDKYELRVDYRNQNYYNFLPAWANPLLSKGSQQGQHGLDVAYRSTDIQFKLFPNSKFRPYVAYSRTSGYGPGYTTYSTETNEFMLRTNWHYAADDYRGGIEMSVSKLCLVIEQGYRHLKNDTGVADVQDPAGNYTRPYLGQVSTMDYLDRGYHDRTTLPVTRVVAKYSPADWLKLTGRYIYSMADTDSALGEVRSGNLLTLEDRLRYRAAIDAFNTRATKPSHNAAFTAEFSPISRLTILDQFDMRSYHVSGSGVLDSTYMNAMPLSGQTPPGPDTSVSHLIGSYLAFDQIRNQTEAEFAIGGGFSLRGGYRYTSTEVKLNDSGDADAGDTEVTQQAGIFGLWYRPNRRVHLGVDYENNTSDGALMRTDLLDYQTVNFDWKIDPLKNLSLSGRVGLLKNRNDQADIDLSSHNRNYSFALNYDFNQRINLTLDYQHSNILSDIAILLPQTLKQDRSIFDERGSAAGGSLGIDFYKGFRADMGLRAILNAGDFPLKYYQPFASLTVPLHGGIAVRTMWQDFSYNEGNSGLQDYRTQLYTFSLLYSR